MQREQLFALHYGKIRLTQALLTFAMAPNSQLRRNNSSTEITASLKYQERRKLD
jgi:predicted membrane chloride channel (bestrophin family)